MFTVENTTKWLHAFHEKVQANQSYLIELDSAIGDGDHGTNMARGLAEVERKLKENSFESPQEVLKMAAMALISKTGGASGPLYGTALLEMSKQVAIDPDHIGKTVEAGLNGILKRGKATTGEKTMVDVWKPVVESLMAEQQLSKERIHQFVSETKEMKATKGRASYLGERSLGHLDPGAVSSGYLFEAMIDGGILS